jgi:FtsP/CotA-like multicopper oxidase with cupredoxin domain
VLVNDTMMTHPIHLHGMWSDLEDEHGNFHVRKHTIDMPPEQAQLSRARRRARPLGLPLPPAVPHGSRDDARSAGVE